jgi:DNA repair exonuclease SbcCD ATPase subunit
MSKIKIAAISVIAVAAAMAVPVVLQQQTIQKLQQENGDLKQQAAQVAPLQDQLAQATQAAANAGGGAEAQVREVARLRGEVQKLRAQTGELAKAQQQIQTLQQRMESDAEARRDQAAAQDANQKKQRGAQAMYACINNLRLIDAAKQQWALENKKQAADIPAMEDLKPYLGHGPNGDLPTCPDGGVYTVGAVSEKPTCSIPGHALP